MTATICPCCGYDNEADRGVQSGRFSYHRDTGVELDGVRLPLPPQGHEILGSLIRARGGVLSKGVLAERLGYEGDGNVVDVQICRIRRTLATLGVSRGHLASAPKRGVFWAALDHQHAGENHDR